ncbi:retrotrans_gag domain-containing protein [Trichonephila clavipes]|nr:retrotrans_gag domain-containing protein [Trichonephila clavipes]
MWNCSAVDELLLRDRKILLLEGQKYSPVQTPDNLRRSLRLRGLSPEFGLLKENSRKRTKIPTEQEAKPAVVTPSLQQWRSPSTFRGAPGEDPLKWLKEYDRVANFNKWDDMMCLANVFFFLDGTARQWYVNNEDALDSWEAFKNGLSGLFGDRQKYTREGQKNN